MNVIKEIIVVEGRDDESAIKRAVSTQTIATHGYGINKNTWEQIEKAYNSRGIIIFTDPDFAGEEIRKKLKARFPEAKEAFLDRKEATKNGDIGIENANPAAILEALEKACCTKEIVKDEFSMEDLFKYQLAGGPEASQRRSSLGKLLGIGYGNGAAFLKKLNQYGIERNQFEEEARKIQ